MPECHQRCDPTYSAVFRAVRHRQMSQLSIAAPIVTVLPGSSTVIAPPFSFANAAILDVALVEHFWPFVSTMAQGPTCGTWIAEPLAGFRAPSA
jgi:hypothetical protein